VNARRLPWLVILGAVSATLAGCTGTSPARTSATIGHTTPAESPAPPTTSPGAEAADRSAQSDLRNGLVAAKTYYLDSGTHAGFSPKSAASIEPGLRWSAKGPARTGEVTIDLARGPQVVLSERSAAGTVFCIADAGSGGYVSGVTDGVGAGSAADCSSGTEW
jgi:hypothetical protein